MVILQSENTPQINLSSYNEPKLRSLSWCFHCSDDSNCDLLDYGTMESDRWVHNSPEEHTSSNIMVSDGGNIIPLKHCYTVSSPGWPQFKSLLTALRIIFNGACHKWQYFCTTEQFRCLISLFMTTYKLFKKLIHYKPNNFKLLDWVLKWDYISNYVYWYNPMRDVSWKWTDDDSAGSKHVANTE
jgi:hypothetical protein